jgi:hypothetical protein
MTRPHRPVLLGAALAAASLLHACGPEQRAAGPEERGPEFFAAALASVEQTPELLRGELLRTCDKWRHLDHPCDEAEVRRDALECWVDKGQATFKWVEGLKLRPRATTMRTLLDVNVCMELKRWRKVRPGPELDSRG